MLCEKLNCHNCEGSTELLCQLSKKRTGLQKGTEVW